MKICASCGKEINYYDKKCPYCGYNYEKEENPIRDIYLELSVKEDEIKALKRRISIVINLIMPGFGLYINKGKLLISIIIFLIYVPFARLFFYGLSNDNLWAFFGGVASIIIIISTTLACLSDD